VTYKTTLASWYCHISGSADVHSMPLYISNYGRYTSVNKRKSGREMGQPAQLLEQRLRSPSGTKFETRPHKAPLQQLSLPYLPIC